MAISYNEFSQIATDNGFSRPDRSKYNFFVQVIQNSKWGISNRQEIAMFLAHVLQETGGFQHLFENGRPSGYDKSHGYPGKEYYGRGYLHLSHSYNYDEATRALYNDPTLLQTPELVEQNEEVAWLTALWFWHARVRSRSGFEQYQFGSTTRAINSMECTNPNLHGLARQRFRYYCTNLQVLGLSGVRPNESGCYN